MSGLPPFNPFSVPEGLEKLAGGANHRTLMPHDIQPRQGRRKGVPFRPDPIHITKTELASRMKTSHASLDRMFDPSNPSPTIASLGKAAALGRKVELRFVPA